MNQEQLQWESRGAIMQQHARDQDLVCKLTEEIKTVNESMEDTVNGLRNEVTKLRSELASMKKDGESSTSGVVKQGRLSKVLLVSLIQI